MMSATTFTLPELALLYAAAVRMADTPSWRDIIAKLESALAEEEATGR